MRDDGHWTMPSRTEWDCSCRQSDTYLEVVVDTLQIMDVYDGCTIWIEDNCPDTFSEFIFPFQIQTHPCCYTLIGGSGVHKQ